MMNLVQYIFDFNKSVDSTAQMPNGNDKWFTERTLLDVKVPTQGLACKQLPRLFEI